MSFCNTDILIRNITQLMKDNGITQEKLADILGMSQPNVSKALSLRDKKCFTLAQVVGAAEHFGVSIDQLVGNTAPKSLETGPRTVARFLAGVIESHDARYTTIEVEEEVFDVKTVYNVFNGPELKTEQVTKKVSYPAIYFPDYWKVPFPEDNSDEEAMALLSEAQQLGNGSRMIPLNDFLRKFIQIFEIHEANGVDDDAYRTVVDSYLGKLRER